jgi:hypothetical protein
MVEKQKIQITGKRIGFGEAEEEDFEFELSLTWQQRLERMEMLRRKIWTFHLGTYPSKIAIVGGKFLKQNTDEDDF